jgi:hypothetical protein
VLTRKRRKPSKVISTSIIEIWLGSVSRDGRTLSGASGTGNRAARFLFEAESLGPRGDNNPSRYLGAVQSIGRALDQHRLVGSH